MMQCTARDGLSCSTCSASNGIHVTVHSILHPFSPKHVCLLLTSAVTVTQLGMIQEAGVRLKPPQVTYHYNSCWYKGGLARLVCMKGSAPEDGSRAQVCNSSQAVWRGSWGSGRWTPALGAVRGGSGRCPALPCLQRYQGECFSDTRLYGPFTLGHALAFPAQPLPPPPHTSPSLPLRASLLLVPPGLTPPLLMPPVPIRFF